MTRPALLALALALAACARQSNGDVEAAPNERADEISTITDVIQAHRNEISTCYAVQLAQNDSLQGRIDVDFTIDKGQVTQVSVVSNTTYDEKLGDCIQERIWQWTFPPEIQTEVSYPFTLNSKISPITSQ